MAVNPFRRRALLTAAAIAPAAALPGENPMLVSDAAQSSGNLMRRIADLERQLREMQAGRRLEAATVGAGGIRIKDGGRLIIEAGGQIQVGDITISSNAIDVAAAGKINLLGTGEIQVGDIKISPNAINVAAAGSINISEGRLNVRDASSNVIVEVGKTSDARYGLRVNNAAGAAQVRAGQLAAGGHGLEAVDAAGKLVTLSTLAFGQSAASATSDLFESTDSTTYTDLTTAGPAVTVTIGNSGRALVIIASEIDLQDAAMARVSVAVSGATTQAPDDRLRVLSFAHESTAIGANLNSSSVFEVAGLNAGSNTFTMKYRSAFAPAFSHFNNRRIIVIPF